jgi:hypothetical protein
MGGRTMNQLFGIPYYHGEISTNDYDKQYFVETITENYTRNPERNRWDHGLHHHSNIHQSFRDVGNESFIKLDYSKIMPVYGEHIKKFMTQLGIVDKVSASFVIANYTCMKSGQFLREHRHGDADFSGVHYIKFNSQDHSPTYYNNLGMHPFFLSVVNDVLVSSLEGTGNDSWAKDYMTVPTKEDDIIIFPGFLQHYVPPFESDELRMVVAFNVKVHAKQ